MSTPPDRAADVAARHNRHVELNRLRMAIVIILLAWTYLYNVLLKDQNPIRAFFEILDTISDDFVMGTFVTVGVGIGIVCVFSFTKLYTQVISNIYSFRIIEDMVYEELASKRYRKFLQRFIDLQNQPLPERACPRRVSSLLASLSFLYAMSWIYVVLFSEALFFVSWSAGVDLPLDDSQKMLFLPTLALAIPFSARVMAYLRYPYAQDYADFMPGAVFVLLVVAALGTIFESGQQKFFLVQVWNNRDYLLSFLKNGVFLAFIPVFFEGGFWMLELSREERHLEDVAESVQEQSAVTK